MERPPTRYAESGGVQVAYQVTGDGPFDLVIAPGTASHLDFDWEHQVFRGPIERWGEVARVIRFDKRGTGLSDRPPGAATLEERADDIRAVMDAAGVERAVLLGVSEGGQMACMFAALYPDRTAALATWGTMGRWVRAPGHPWGLTEEQVEEMLEDLRRNWPSEHYLRAYGAGLGESSDATLLDFLMRRSQAGASPAAALALEEMNAAIDIRDLLPTIHVPTLVMCNSHDPVAPADGVRAMADAIPGARFAEFPGTTHFMADNLDAVVATLVEFVTGQPPTLPTTRRLVTVLFVDIVGSTERAVEEGDAAWRDTLGAFYAIVERALALYDGAEVDRAGDGVLAVFDGPTRSISCACAIRDGAAGVGLTLRCGVHTGEVEQDGSAIRGIAVHVAARICAAASPGDVLVSSTVRDLTVGSSLSFADRGAHALKGVPESRQLYAVVE